VDRTDSLTLVAGIRSNQREKLEVAGINTLKDLAESRGQIATFEVKRPRLPEEEALDMIWWRGWWQEMKAAGIKGGSPIGPQRVGPPWATSPMLLTLTGPPAPVLGRLQKNG
jgi:hypothetical protein